MKTNTMGGDRPRNEGDGVPMVASSAPCGMCGHNILLHHREGCSVWHDDVDLPCPCTETAVWDAPKRGRRAA